MVLPEGRLLVRLSISLRRLAGFLRQHHHDECYERVVRSLDSLRIDFRRLPCLPILPGLEAQPLYVSEAIWGVGPLLHLPALRHIEPARVGLAILKII